jgi:pimeloyl-ACP methyl ester carboxylesterase
MRLNHAMMLLALSVPAEAAPAARRLANGSFTADLNGHSIHYEVHGKGPVLMTLPNSWGLTLQALRAMYRPLERRLTLVYFDPRGMGGSAPARTDADRGMAAVREDFDALRRHLGLDRVNAIGWSNGAMNLLLLASERPEMLESAIFLHGTASFGHEEMQDFGRRFPEMTARFGAFQKEVADPALTDDARTALQRRFWMDAWFPFMLADARASTPRLREVFRGQPFSYPHAQQTGKEAAGFDVRDRLGKITARSLVLAGAKDVAPPATVRVIADGIPGARFHVFEKSGHFAPFEEPEAFRRAVFDFLLGAR